MNVPEGSISVESNFPDDLDPDQALKERKEALRLAIKERRGQLTRDQLKGWSQSITEQLKTCQEYKATQSILVYLAAGQEVETRALIDHALAENKKVHVPRVNRDQGELEVVQLPDWEIEFKSGPFGIQEPNDPKARVVPAEQLDLVVTPGLVFDAQGGRVGYGKGYFDRLFSRLTPDCQRVAVAYDFQIVDHVPQSLKDIPVHKIITELRIIPCVTPGGSMGF